MATAMPELHCICTNNACLMHVMICERIAWLSTTAQHACPSYATQCIHMRTLIRFDPGMLKTGALLVYNVVSLSLPGFPVVWFGFYFLQELVCGCVLAGWAGHLWGWGVPGVLGVQLFMVFESVHCFLHCCVPVGHIVFGVVGALSG